MGNKKKLLITFLISLFYVALGTLSVMVIFPKYKFMGFDYNHPLWIPLVIITLPVNILLFGLVMVEKSLLLIGILQTLVLVVFWMAIYYLFKKK
ncbi:hypothetical protein [Siphonobacter sp. SORGH_AS_1065]|uniref:hypothetical protein n=1 Tax=Siphonobacter sp. SORGH_AS_1065 TaxID=3041795 RepID=UPI002784E4CD|nr:hypothetical protein [Siphonobacter sp. SORGH_AS_1065]MDQ1086541.1 hypothetical protein [Siphonobacter sp. SORGH_AS_1065]